MTDIRENKMGTEPIFPLLLKMSGPAILSMLISAIYNIVDSIYVARVSEEALRAVSLAFPAQMIIISIAVGTGVGVNSLVARRLGEKSREKASSAATNGLIIAVLSAIAIAVFGLIFSGKFIGAFTNDQTVYQYGTDYLFIVTVFCAGSVVEIIINKILQATGNMVMPMITQLVGAIANIILDPIFIFGYFGCPAMGVKGAAIATVIGQFFAMLLALYIAFFKKHDVDINLKKYRLSAPVAKEIYRVGLPSIFMQAIGSLVVGFFNAILKNISEVAVSVLGIYFKLQSFVFMPLFGMTQGLVPIFGYNFGAKSKKRLDEALKAGMILGIVIMIAGTLLFWLFPSFLLSLFKATPEMETIGVWALRSISLCFIPLGYGVVISVFFQAIGHGFKSLLISFLRQVIIIIPLAYILSKIGLNYIWASFPIAEIVSAVIATALFASTYKKMVSPFAAGSAKA